MTDFFPFQKIGADWLSEKRHALLADEMGLGKSAQTILAADMKRLRRVLVICPAIARINWEREFKLWSVFSRDFQIVTKLFEELRPGCSVICSYDWAIYNSEKLRQAWDLVIIDEVQFLKSVGAKRAKAIFGKESLAHTASRIWALSGTPAPNHAGELWILLYTFGVTKLGYTDFLSRYCDQANTPYGWKVVGTKRAAIPELKELLKKVMLRRKVEEVLPELPSIFYSEVTVEPGYVHLTAEMKLQVETETVVLGRVLDEMDRADNRQAIRMLEALAQSISTLLRYSGLQKIEPAVELVSQEMELGLYDKIVIFGVHKDVVKGIARGLEKFGSVTVTGDTSPGERQKAVDHFQKDPKCKVFVGNIKAAGTAITLHAAHQELFAEKSFTPGDNLQAAKRCHRLGQTRNVNARFLTLANPMDEKVTRILRKKTSELTELLG